MRVDEGAVTLDLPDRELSRSGPAKRSSAFYNPAMAASRDVSVLVHDALAGEVRSVLDGLAGAGARGLRVAAETDVEEVVLDDLDADAVATIRRSAKASGLDVDVHQADLRDLLPDVDVDAIDVDPYGTPAPWIDPVLDVLDVGDLLAFSATDTAVLHGAEPDVMQRRYDAQLVRQPAEKEIGQRILLGFVARRAADRDRGIDVLCSFTDGHHLRAFCRVTDDPVDRVPAHRCPDCGDAWLGDDRPCPCAGRPATSGPVWSGPLGDPALLDRLDADREVLGAPKRTRKLVGRLRDEADGTPLFVDVHRIGKERGCSVPTMDAVLDELRDQGHVATRTHFADTGVRTDAPRRVVADVVEGSAG